MGSRERRFLKIFINFQKKSFLSWLFLKNTYLYIFKPLGHRPLKLGLLLLYTCTNWLGLNNNTNLTQSCALVLLNKRSQVPDHRVHILVRISLFFSITLKRCIRVHNLNCRICSDSGHFNAYSNCYA